MTIDGKLCLLYLGGLPLGVGFFCCSESSTRVFGSALRLREVEQKLDRNPRAEVVFRSSVCSGCFSRSVAWSWLAEAHQRKEKKPMVETVFLCEIWPKSAERRELTWSEDEEGRGVSGVVWSL